MTLAVFTHADCAGHQPLPGHPERPERLQAVLAGLEQLADRQQFEARPATPAELARVHRNPYLDQLAAIEAEIDDTDEVVSLDADTRAGPGSFTAARLAVGAACQAVEHCVQRPADSSFAVVRPPGHHAEPARAMGFCLYNAVAAAAEHALTLPGIRRVAIADFDVHHGNGTEAIFAGRRDVLFVSSHQLPLYPGSGDPRQAVAANVLNCALPPGSGSNEFRYAWQHGPLERIERFKPDLVLLSAGFDAHWRDPLAQLDLKDEDFYWIGHELKNIARRCAQGRLAATLEGGYDLHALTESALAFAEGIA
ncbi:MAG: histone deacetylase family protein [Wenzhouxiangellaceae bacterium]|nr:histone deacetylase family protein [Wenzhouxiangellaceae bacterium]